MVKKKKYMVLFAGLLVGAMAHGQPMKNLLTNGSFSDPTDPLKTWTIDYEWTKNSNYVGNRGRVSAKASEAGHNTVAYVASSKDAGTKRESILIPFEYGYQYTCTLDVKGGPHRLYFAGYRWAPGIRPHETPKPEEMRLIYKGKVAKGDSSGWERKQISVPGLKVSSLAAKNLKHVRYVTAYVWMMRDGYIDDVKITRRKAPELYP